MTVTTQYARDHFEELLTALDQGQSVRLEREGKPGLLLSASLAEPCEDQQPRKRRFGLGRGTIWMAPDWDSPEVNAEVAAEFEKSEILPSTLEP